MLSKLSNKNFIHFIQGFTAILHNQVFSNKNLIHFIQGFTVILHNQVFSNK